LRALGCRSALLVPLVARGRTLGALTCLAAESGRRYDRADLAQAEQLAQRAALAVDNARLYDEAQEAVRCRDRFLAVLAPELRNPRAAVRNGVEVLRRRGLADPELERVRQAIDRQGQHMGRLLDDLLDVSRVIHGKVELRREVVDLAAVLGDAVQAAR